MNQKSPEAFRTISEVAEWLGVPTHVLRFWESRFSQVKPVKRAGGRRYYRPSDMELLGGIRKLLHEDGMTIRGVQKLLREEGVKYVAALSPSLESGTDIGDAIGSNVVELSGRREPAEELVIEDAELVPEPEPAAEPEPEVSAPSAPATAAGRPGDSPDLSEEFPSPEALEFIAHEAEPDTFETASELPDSPRPAAGVPEPSSDPADPMSSPEALDFAAHDALPEGAWAEDAPEAADTAGSPQADLADAGEADILAAPARPALVLPDIGPDPADDAGTTGAPLVAARLRAARDAKAEPPAAALQALANRLEGLSIRMRQSAAPHRPL